MDHLTIVETILRSRRKFFTEIRQQIDVAQKIRAMLFACLVFLAIYGVVMGASHSFQQAVASFVKLPICFWRRWQFARRRCTSSISCSAPSKRCSRRLR
jgi:hypothetical protein